MSMSVALRHALSISKGPRPTGIEAGQHIACRDNIRESSISGEVVHVANTSEYVHAEGRYPKAQFVSWQGDVS